MYPSWKPFITALLIGCVIASVLGLWKGFETGICYAKRLGNLSECSYMVLWSAEFIYPAKTKLAWYD